VEAEAAYFQALLLPLPHHWTKLPNLEKLNESHEFDENMLKNTFKLVNNPFQT
jgi:hypothetical protein